MRESTYAANTMTWPHRPIPPFSVLIVEDNVPDCLYLERIVSADVRFRVDATASSFQLAMTAVQRLSFDLLVVNLQLSDGHGLDIIRHAMEKERARETLALTATHNSSHCSSRHPSNRPAGHTSSNSSSNSSNNYTDVFDAIRAGATGFLLKDEAATHITEAMVRLMSGESPISAMISASLLKRFRLTMTSSSASTRLSPTLSATERELLGLISRGLTCADAAVALELKPSTIASYVKNIYRKLHVRSRAQATREAVRLGLITL